MDEEQLNQLTQLINRGKEIIKTKRPYTEGGHYFAHKNVVNESLFIPWYRDVRAFLSSNNLREHIALEPIGANQTNFNTCTEQIDKLEWLKMLYS